jgi:hypothetical protein
MLDDINYQPTFIISKILHNNAYKIMLENTGQTFYRTVKDVAIESAARVC